MNMIQRFGITPDCDEGNLPNRMEFLLCTIAALHILEKSGLVPQDEPHITIMRGPMSGVVLSYYTREQTDEIAKRRDEDIKLLAAHMISRLVDPDDLGAVVDKMAAHNMKGGNNS